MVIPLFLPAPDTSELLSSMTNETILNVDVVIPCREFQVASSPMGLLPETQTKKNVIDFGKMLEEFKFR